MGVQKYDLMLLDGYLVLNIARESFICDNKDNDFVLLGGKVHKIKNGFILELFELIDVQDNETLALIQPPNS